jgi:uncharacterized protein YndB with AHSA1/START domain
MPSIEERIEIAAPTSTVFRACQDAAKRPEWDERVKRIELITPEPVRQGTLFQVDAASSGGSIFGWEGEYVEFKYPMSATLKVLDAAPSSPFKSGTEVWQYSAVSGHTQVAVTWEYQPRNIVFRLFDVIAGRAMTRRAIRRSLSNLKKMVENG